jgi:hypothetical protein
MQSFFGRFREIDFFNSLRRSHKRAPFLRHNSTVPPGIRVEEHRPQTKVMPMVKHITAAADEFH